MTAAFHSGLQTQRWDSPVLFIFVHAWSLFLGGTSLTPRYTPRRGGRAQASPFVPKLSPQKQSRLVVTSPCSGIGEMWVQNLL